MPVPPQKVADLVLHDFTKAYDNRTACRKAFADALADLTVSVELAGARTYEDMVKAECVWEAFAYVSKHLNNATRHPAGANPDLSRFTAEEILVATAKARADAEDRLRSGSFNAVGMDVVWYAAHRAADRTFLTITSLVGMSDVPAGSPPC